MSEPPANEYRVRAPLYVMDEDGRQLRELCDGTRNACAFIYLCVLVAVNAWAGGRVYGHTVYGKGSIRIEKIFHLIFQGVSLFWCVICLLARSCMIKICASPSFAHEIASTTTTAKN